MTTSAPTPRPGRGGRPPRRPPGTASAGTPVVPTPASGGRTAAGRPRWVVLLWTLLGTVVVGGAAWGVLTLVGAPAPTHTVAVPSPTPTVSPVPREATTAFAAALPTSVLQYALASSVPDGEWVTAGALEAYLETYEDGAGGAVTLRVGQWPSSAEAEDMFRTLTAAGAGAGDDPSPSPSDGLPRYGAVQVDGATVGNYVIVDNGDGTGTVTWSNSTAVLQISGQLAEATRAYSAFSM